MVRGPMMVALWPRGLGARNAEVQAARKSDKSIVPCPPPLRAGIRRGLEREVAGMLERLAVLERGALEIRDDVLVGALAGAARELRTALGRRAEPPSAEADERGVST